MTEVKKFKIGKQTEERVFKAHGLTDLSDLQAVIDAVEAALSTDAEPVAWRTYDHDDGKWFLFETEEEAKEVWPQKNIRQPLYTAPPAPSVAVKALDWERRESISRYSGMTGYYSILLLDDGQWKFTYGSPGKTATFDVSKHPNRDEAEKAAQDVHNTMIRAALSAQVQDVAGWQRLDDAFCNFINGYGDPYEPKEDHDKETAHNLKVLYEAFNEYRAAPAAKLEEKP